MQQWKLSPLSKWSTLTPMQAGTMKPSRACVTLHHTHIITELLDSTGVCTKQAQTILQTPCDKPRDLFSNEPSISSSLSVLIIKPVQ